MQDWFPNVPLFDGTLTEWPFAVVAGIAELRAYAQAKAALEAAKTADDAPEGPMVDRVFDVLAELKRRGDGG